MSGTAVLRYLLAQNAAVVAIVPAVRIMAGDLPLGTTLPALAVTQIDSMPRTTVAMTEGHRLHTDRVQVSVLVKGPEGSPAGTGYPGVKALLKLVLAACPNTRGVINGVAVDAIICDIEGPDLCEEDTAIYGGSRDFFVRWTEP